MWAAIQAWVHHVHSRHDGSQDHNRDQQHELHLHLRRDYHDEYGGGDNHDSTSVQDYHSVNRFQCALWGLGHEYL